MAGPLENSTFQHELPRSEGLGTRVLALAEAAPFVPTLIGLLFFAFVIVPFVGASLIMGVTPNAGATAAPGAWPRSSMMVTLIGATMSILLYLSLFAALAFIVINIRRRMRAGRIVKTAVEDFATKFSSWDAFVSAYDQSIVGVQGRDRKVVLGTVSQYQIYSFEDVTSAETLVTQHTNYVTHHDPQYYNSWTGSIRGGDETRSVDQRTQGLQLKVVVNDPTTPIYVVTFFSNPQGTSASTDLVASNERAEHFQAVLANAVEHPRARVHAAFAHGSSGASPVDEIERLWKLKEAGALTEAEFEGQKSELLSRS